MLRFIVDNKKGLNEDLNWSSPLYENLNGESHEFLGIIKLDLMRILLNFSRENLNEIIPRFSKIQIFTKIIWSLGEVNADYPHYTYDSDYSTFLSLKTG